MRCKVNFVHIVKEIMPRSIASRQRCMRSSKQIIP